MKKIKKPKKPISEIEMAKRVNEFVIGTYGRRSIAALEWDITRDMIDKICRGDRPPGDSVLKDMGYVCNKTTTRSYSEL